jgi:hypothetical protein
MPPLAAALLSWARSHFVTAAAIALGLIASVLSHFVRFTNPIALAFLAVFASPSCFFAVAHTLFLLLFSGLEPSVQSIPYALWLFWSASVCFCVRLLLRVGSTGPSFVVFSPFFAFAAIHRPTLYFRIRRFAFADTLLYAIAVLQYTANAPLRLPVDLASCVAANLLWKLGNLLLRRR